MALEIVPVTHEELKERLRERESMCAYFLGTSLTSADFYERFKAGEFDTQFGMAWATDYEAAVLASTPAASAFA